MRFGIVVFPGTWSDRDTKHALSRIGEPAEYVWHASQCLDKYKVVILPGGFSYGDYLRPGAIARFSPIMNAVEKFADKGGIVIGICNGFQILCEAGILEGTLIRNDHMQFRCAWTYLRVENSNTPFTGLWSGSRPLRIPISHGAGNYYADSGTLARLKSERRVLFRYSSVDNECTNAANPNGSINNIAGIVNRAYNVLGMMPHPERACEPLLGSEDGKIIFASVVRELSKDQ